MENTKLLEKFFAAENSRDWATFRGCLHPQVMWFLHTETTHMPVAGREEYMDRILSGYQSAAPDKGFTCESMMSSKSGNRIVATIRNSDGGRSVDVFDFEDGLIRWEYEYLMDS